ncbi:prolipoprotein diacylglyceryl transferase [Campylobacter sp. RM9344]|uniref:Phosphatidylglycerol--prolipoprotein diacylglyceryl transferase n=1 Tax=Campylobacter californiensis TaxID=1032243 RepID=A0AAW3ZWU3_9BACT|nr:MULTISPECIES: prolipoprotein diacylglyceryl transferase [unclassified Campylobacter]MBE2985281.1 prolipoprotein diacylglyceryl transferase [Campylobacter sp. RM6883]MBE2995908.1 prolipoprotein diacylglyceryl transferase [Campylobacter sp. RM6913]MBE3030035.1 prolipoprotein diacylglyceryl transferase [Campylobacter sp. RM9344]MBE3608806.1 prolipoprotein diacylglyceryl transferase [Campylobacter sp. RM9337]QCD51281.1 phosphatidylglycerol-prolipoprotein diacylglyceryl transferase [Campylobacte
MTTWNNIYNHFDPVAFSLFGFNVHWYGIMYVLALLGALAAAKYFVKKDKIPITDAMLDNYFFWVEIGVILGARLGYIAIYSGEAWWYFTNPWQIFNPFYNGEFVGIRGMSYHGAVVGFLLATLLYCKKYKQNLWLLLDLCALSIPFGYFFGRVGNFLNQELFGRVSDVPWAINVLGALRHPSQLYEAFLEGVVIFVILFFYRKYKKFHGELICIYAVLYTLARFICEFYREPDVGIGFVFLNFSMGQILSTLMFSAGIGIYIFLRKINNNI